jgi:putative sterol carrier protein
MENLLKSSLTEYVIVPDGVKLNGLGSIMDQYLKQNLADIGYKVKQAQDIDGSISIEIENSIAVTVFFEGNRIRIENGIVSRPDLHLISSYALLASVLSGKANPLIEIIRGNIKLGRFLKRPIQAIKMLRFFKIPSEFRIQTSQKN